MTRDELKDEALQVCFDVFKDYSAVEADRYLSGAALEVWKIGEEYNQLRQGEV